MTDLTSRCVGPVFIFPPCSRDLQHSKAGSYTALSYELSSKLISSVPVSSGSKEGIQLYITQKAELISRRDGCGDVGDVGVSGDDVGDRRR